MRGFSHHHDTALTTGRSVTVSECLLLPCFSVIHHRIHLTLGCRGCLFAMSARYLLLQFTCLQSSLQGLLPVSSGCRLANESLRHRSARTTDRLLRFTL